MEKKKNNAGALVLLALYLITLIGLVEALPNVNSNGNIVIPGNEEYKFSDLVILDPSVFEIVNGQCNIKAPLDVQGIIREDGSSCNTVNLYPNSYIQIRGSMFIENVIITSFDPATNSPIIKTKENYNEPRPYIIMVAPGRNFYAKNVEFEHLGYYDVNSKGSAWGLAFYNIPKPSNGAPSIQILDSKIHNNYFGVYTFNTDFMIIKNTEVYNNVEYGLDFHDYSSDFIISGNEIYNNGNHNLIFSKFCENNTISDNYIHDTPGLVFAKGENKDYGIHGIMLHHFSTENDVINNTIINTNGGISLQDSDNNLIKDNSVMNDNEDGIYIATSNNNEFYNNELRNSTRYGIYSVDSYNNKYENNIVDKGFYIKGESGDEKYSHFFENGNYDQKALDEAIKKQGIQSNFLGVKDKALVSKVFLIIGLLSIVFLIIVIEVFFILTKKVFRKYD